MENVQRERKDSIRVRHSSVSKRLLAKAVGYAISAEQAQSEFARTHRSQYDRRVQQHYEEHPSHGVSYYTDGASSESDKGVNMEEIEISTIVPIKGEHPSTGDLTTRRTRWRPTLKHRHSD